MTVSSAHPELDDAPGAVPAPARLPVPMVGALLYAGIRLVSVLLTAVWAVSPSSVVLTMVYAEALFCALAVWAMVALVSKRWLTAGLLTLAAGTVRSTALALIAAVAVAAAIAVITAVRTRQPFAAWWRPAAAVLLAPLGLQG